MLCGDGQHVVLDLDLDLIGLDAGNVGAQQVLIVALDDVHGQAPLASLAALHLRKHAVGTAVEILTLGERMPPRRSCCHEFSFVVHTSHCQGRMP